MAGKISLALDAIYDILITDADGHHGRRRTTPRIGEFQGLGRSTPAASLGGSTISRHESRSLESPHARHPSGDRRLLILPRSTVFLSDLTGLADFLLLRFFPIAAPSVERHVLRFAACLVSSPYNQPPALHLPSGVRFLDLNY